MRSASELRVHAAYAGLQLSVSPAQLAAIKRLGPSAWRDPILVTREGIIIDGYARKAYADIVGVSTLACVEFDIGEEEALRMILNKHGRTAGWSDYNRIRMASQLKTVLQARARANQQAGGQLKGSSKLTEANVRKGIAEAANVSEGNVTKFDQLQKSDPQILMALATGETSIHRAWLWRNLLAENQREELRRYRLLKGLKQRVKTRALGSSPHRLTRIVLTVARLKELLHRALSMPSGDGDEVDLIAIGPVAASGKIILLSTELYEALWARGITD